MYYTFIQMKKGIFTYFILLFFTNYLCIECIIGYLICFQEKKLLQKNAVVPPSTSRSKLLDGTICNFF